MSGAAPSGFRLVRWLRLAFAAVLPSAIAGFVGALILSFNVLASMIADPADEAAISGMSRSGLVLIGTIIGATLGQCATVFIGLPAHGYLMRYSSRRAWMYALTGAIAGLIFGGTLIWPLLFGAVLPSATNVGWLTLASLAAGAVGGVVFWLIRRPDLDHPTTS